jgi:hypothetical protein
VLDEHITTFSIVHPQQTVAMRPGPTLRHILANRARRATRLEVRQSLEARRRQIHARIERVKEKLGALRLYFPASSQRRRMTGRSWMQLRKPFLVA